jgi:hypothetical protein
MLNWKVWTGRRARTNKQTNALGRMQSSAVEAAAYLGKIFGPSGWIRIFPGSAYESCRASRLRLA